MRKRYINIFEGEVDFTQLPEGRPVGLVPRVFDATNIYKACFELSTGFADVTSGTGHPADQMYLNLEPVTAGHLELGPWYPREHGWHALPLGGMAKAFTTPLLELPHQMYKMNFYCDTDAQMKVSVYVGAHVIEF